MVRLVSYSLQRAFVNVGVPRRISPYLGANERWCRLDVQRYNREYIGLVHIIPCEAVQRGNLYLLRSEDGISCSED